MLNNKLINKKSILSIITVAFGYFVDAYDLIVASVVRKAAIINLKLASADDLTKIKQVGQYFEYAQSFGILMGGILFGVLGDRIGRRKVLFISIFVYSLAQLLTGCLTSEMPYVKEVYALLRIICGAALAAELSAGIVLISEVMKPNERGYGSMLVVAFGILGCSFAAFLAHFKLLEWNQMFLLGGAMGLLLLVLRNSVQESELFNQYKENSNTKTQKEELNLHNQIEEERIQNGVVFIFRNKRLRNKFGLLIIIGLPIYFFVSVPIKFASDFAKEIGIGEVQVTISIIMFYLALSISDIIGNAISQYLHSRKKVIFGYIATNIVVLLLLCFVRPSSASQYHYVFCPLMGICAGYWALLITFISEQIGTNYRTTFATIIPNIIRSLFIPITLMLSMLTPSFGTANSVFVVGLISCILALVGLKALRETFGKDLNFLEK
jgi:MFS transporter, putative metabolite:H+ symporter